MQICHDTVNITCAVGEQKQDAREEAAPAVNASHLLSLEVPAARCLDYMRNIGVEQVAYRPRRRVALCSRNG
jgi:hypothetical protein